MPPSQLKRLKTSLREHGVVGAQKSKKQKKQASKNGSARDGRIQRNAALREIREQFNPFEVRTPSRVKHEVTSNWTVGGKMARGVVGRPGVTKGLGEENRRKTLLVEMHQRKKVGGILDRRFGENDPTMTPEEKALERFVKEKQKGNKRGALFNLEDAQDDGQLTHFGESLSFDRSSRMNGIKEASVEVSDNQSSDETDGERPSKRRRTSDGQSSEEDLPVMNRERPAERPKTKKEVMSEVIAKSKLHKYERQKAKEDDDDLRAELDKGLPDVFALLKGTPRQPTQPQKAEPLNSGMNPDRAALLDRKDRPRADKEYDERLRQMVFDQRSKPTERTMTEEEKLQYGAQRLKELEERRLRRMSGVQDSNNENGNDEKQGLHGDDLEWIEQDTFGLGSGLAAQEQRVRQLGVEDEDEFVIEHNIVATGSDIGTGESDSGTELETESSGENNREFVDGLLSKSDMGRGGLVTSTATDIEGVTHSKDGDLAYTYICPQTHEDLLRITKDIPADGIPTVIQRIRTLYHPKLHSDNKAKLGTFSSILVDHISFLANQTRCPPFSLLETLIRHLHSLAKTFSTEIGRSFRSHLKSIHENRPTAPMPGDLVLLTAVSSIFSTSDHFHQVVTPAALCITRYLSQRVPQTLTDLATGTYVGSLCLQYQWISKRYVPELVNYTLNTLWALAPTTGHPPLGSFPYHDPKSSLHIKSARKEIEFVNRQLKFSDILPSDAISEVHDEELKVALIESHLRMTGLMADIWADKPAFCEIFDPFVSILQHLTRTPYSAKLPVTTIHLATKTLTTLTTLFHQSRLARRPLALHSHRPLAIKTSIPKFEESYTPGRHYDPDRERADSSKLKAEHKRERKGALRELRKDANFMAREGLREKRERDGEYEKKFKRLVAEIQGEEGREKKGYEREKRMRKGRR